MKRILLTASVLAGVLSQASTVVGTAESPSALLYVGPNTLYYDSGDVNVNSTAVFGNETETGTPVTGIVNKGNVKINGAVNVAESGVENFLMTFSNTGSYGQLILNGEQPFTGNVGVRNNRNIEIKEVNMAFPFSNFKFGQLITVWGGVGEFESVCQKGKLCANFTKQPLYTPDTEGTTFTTDPATSADLTSGVAYYVNVSDKSVNFPNKGNAEGNSPWLQSATTYRGTPTAQDTGFDIISRLNADQTAKLEIGSDSKAPNLPGGIGKGTNAYAIKWYTVLFDPFSGKTIDAEIRNADLNAVGFHNNILQIGNPYTSNISLAQITRINAANAPIEGFMIQRDSKTGGDPTSPAVKDFAIAKYNTAGSPEGDIKVTAVRPMETFFIKVASNVQDPRVVLDQSVKTFEYDNNGLGFSEGVRTNSGASVNQVQLSLLAGKDKVNHTYAVGSEIYNEGTEEKKHVRNISLDDTKGGIYTLPLSKGGVLAPSAKEDRLYINDIGNDAMGVAQPLGFKAIKGNASGRYTIQSELAENGVTLAKEVNNFTDPSSKFFFHDKKENKLVEITNDFSYTFIEKGDTDDRFELFYGRADINTNEDENTPNIPNTPNNETKTQVYRDGNVYKVRFEEDMKQAKVTIYNSLGQLVGTNQVKTANGDYTLPINSNVSQIYIIRIEGDNGSVTSKKIIK